MEYLASRDFASLPAGPYIVSQSIHVSLKLNTTLTDWVIQKIGLTLFFLQRLRTNCIPIDGTARRSFQTVDPAPIGQKTSADCPSVDITKCPLLGRSARANTPQVKDGPCRRESIDICCCDLVPNVRFNYGLSGSENL